MRKALIAVIVLFLFSFCEKEYKTQEEINPVPACTVFEDWSGRSVPSFQGNCYLITNAQVRWAQNNLYITTISLAPDNNTCPTKAQLESYGLFAVSDQYNALSSSNCVPIGYIGAYN